MEANMKPIRPVWHQLGQVSTLVLAALIAQPALAQSSSVQSTKVQSTTAQSTIQPQTGYLEEVTVTAQRREERSLDVPISITTLGADALGKGDVQQLSDVMKLTPGLRFDNQGALSQPTIRGVGTAVAVSGGGSNVGIYTDGFYSPNPFFADADFLQVQSVQVLKGPQGTLFGRNSTGGAILVTTAEPSTETRAEIGVSYGSYNTQKYDLYATGGATETLAFDIAAQARSSDGFLENSYTGKDDAGSYDRWSVRVGAKWDVTDDTSVLLRYTRTDGDDRRAVAANGFEKDGTVYAAGAAFGGEVASKPKRVSSDFQPEFFSQSDVVQLTVKTELSFASLTSYTQYRRERTDNEMDFDFSSLPVFHYLYDVNDDIFTQEFLLSSNDVSSPLQWTTGLFLFANENEYVNNQASFGGGPFAINGGSGTDTRSVAVFGDVTYALTDNLFLTGGLRFSYDETKDAYLTLDVDPQGQLIQQDVESIDDTKVTPRVVLRYTPTDSSSLYASYTEGYKSGLLNVGGKTLTGIEVEPEELKAYEIGYKYSSNQLTFDVAAYYYDYQDLQVATFDGPQSLIENAASSRVYGLDAQLRWAMTEKLSVNVGGAYVNAKYEDFDRSQAWTQCMDLAACGGNFGMFEPSYVDASDNEMQRSPEFTANLGVNYTTGLAEGWLSLSGTLYHTSDFYFDSSEQFKQDAYELLSLRAEWTDPSDRYTVALFADNVTNEEYRSQVLPQQMGALSMWGTPATFGVSFNARFQ
jgi:iron complex outermembrane receptor protein